MLIYLSIWASIVIGMLWIVARQGNASTGLPLAYILMLSLIHVPGAALVLVGTSTMREWTQIGFQQTIYGMGAFLGGVALAYALSARGRTLTNVVSRRLDSWQLRVLDRVALDYIVIGATSYFLLDRLIGGFGTLNAVISALGAALVGGVCLRLWVQKQVSNSRKFWSTIAFVLLLPFYTVVQSGFIAAAIVWVSIVATFLFSQSKRKWLFYALGPIAIFLGLSVFTSYMTVRPEIRQLVWYENAPMADRLGKVSLIFSNLNWLNLNDPDQANTIDLRLNQNWLVGLGVQRLNDGEASFTSGASFGAMVLALIPRAMWPDKPAVGGGGDLVRNVTGVEFAESTSVGVGQVLEFYMNFGSFGVLAGFTLWGWLLAYCDRRSAACLHRADHAGFILWFVVAIALIQPGGNLLEIEIAAVSSALSVQGLGLLITRRARPRQLNTANIRSPRAPRYLHPNA
jgi:hypothetical protein